MCLPTAVVGGIGLLGSIASAAFGAVGAVQQANAQNAMAEYNAKVAENNAKVMEQEGAYARAQAARNADEKRRETARIIGAQRAKMGASGAVVDSGSFLDLTLDTAEGGELDAMALLQEGDMQAWRAQLQAGNYYNEASQARASKVNSGSVLAGSLLSGAAGVAGSYFSLDQAGVFDSGGSSEVYAPPMGNRTASRGGFKSENRMGGMY